MSKVIDLVSKRVTPVIESMGYEVVDIEYKSEFGAMTLTFFIFSGKEGGTDLEDCEKVHYAISDILDELDPTEGLPYNLNVSSPGIDRAFKTVRDYERNMNKDIEIRLFAPVDNKKEFIGRLTGIEADGKDFEISVNINGSLVKFSSSQLARVRQHIKF